MSPQELVDAARQAVADWNDGRSAGPAGQALRDAVVGLLDLRAKDTDHIFDLVRQVDEGLAERDRLSDQIRHLHGLRAAEQATIKALMQAYDDEHACRCHIRPPCWHCIDCRDCAAEASS